MVRRLQPFVAFVAALTAAVAVWLGLDPVSAMALAGTCTLFASAMLPPGSPEPAPVTPTVVPEPPTADPKRLSQPVREVLEEIPVPLLVIADSERLAFANAAARASLPNVQTGGPYAHLIRAPGFVSAVASTLDDGALRTVEFQSRQGGGDRVFEARVAGFRGGERQALVLLEDRTRIRRAEEMRSDFIANASHELRTPLAAIIGYIETLQNHAREDPEAQERFLGIMAREAGRMQRLVDDLMSLSRIEMNEHLRPSEAVSLFQIAAEAAAALQSVAGQSGVELTVELEPDDPRGRVVGDRDQLVQVFTNLIDNAIKYGGEKVTVSEGPPEDAVGRVGVAVRDSGAGIAREHLPRLTERFYRANVGQSRARGGTGLGLAIVKHILNRHRGRLEIVSTPGEGSTFTVWVPRGEAGSAETYV